MRQQLPCDYFVTHIHGDHCHPARSGWPNFLGVARLDGADAEHGRGNAALLYLRDRHIDRGKRARAECHPGKEQQKWR